MLLLLVPEPHFENHRGKGISYAFLPCTDLSCSSRGWGQMLFLWSLPGGTSLVVCIVLSTLKNKLGRIFTNDE